MSTDIEKATTKHVQVAAFDPISEEDEGPNVGLAAYEQSKRDGGVIVSLVVVHTDTHRRQSRTSGSEFGSICFSFPSFSSPRLCSISTRPR